jgi:hypothetical protein
MNVPNHPTALTPGGVTFRFKPGELYVLFGIANVEWCVFRYTGLEKRKKRVTERFTRRTYEKGAPLWFLTRDLLAHRKQMKEHSSIQRSLLHNWRFSHITERDLPLYIHLPFKYPTWDQLMGVSNDPAPQQEVSAACGV